MADRFVPDSFVVPGSLDGPGFHLEPLGPRHNERDYAAWSSSMDHIHATPGDWRDWPRPMTIESNLEDLEQHERDFEKREGFTYSVLDGDQVIGCLYIYPDGQGDSDAYVSSWVSAERAEMDTVVWETVSEWLRDTWPFRSFRYAERS